MSHRDHGEFHRHSFAGPGTYAEFNVPELYMQMGAPQFRRGMPPESAGGYMVMGSPYPEYAQPAPPPFAGRMDPRYQAFGAPENYYSQQQGYQQQQFYQPHHPHYSHHRHHRHHSHAHNYYSHAGRHHEFAGGAYEHVRPADRQTLASSVHTVVEVAREYGLSPNATRAAVAAMLAESKGNPRAVGDYGTSFGLFQLHRGGELTQAHLSPQQAFDPMTNARVALRYFKQHENISDPGYLAAAAQRPRWRGEYARVVDGYLGTADQLIRQYGDNGWNGQNPGPQPGMPQWNTPSYAPNDGRVPPNQPSEVPITPYWQQNPGDNSTFDNLRQAIVRANSGGRPLSVAQIGDSHIAEGTESATIAQRLGQLGPVEMNRHGVVGARATDAAMNPNTWLNGINANTDLVILSFGSNDSAGPINAQEYAGAYNRLIAEVRQKAPNASILMVGPTDGAISGRPNVELPSLNKVIAAQEQVAAQNGVAYFDLRSQMGSIGQMRQQGLMAGDNLHFNRNGYSVIGNDVADFIRSNI